MSKEGRSAKESLANRRVVMGVSLSNLVFTRLFARRLLTWLRESGAVFLDVVLFDAIEVINYSVFRQIPVPESERIALRRAEELSGLFTRMDGSTGLTVRVNIESLSEIRKSMTFQEVAKELVAGYGNRSQFWSDVQWQVKENLVERRRKCGDEFVHRHMDTLAGYVLDEVAFFYTYFQLNPGAIEVYPGPGLVIKEKFFHGDYRAEICRDALVPVPLFVNVSFLVAQQGVSCAAPKTAEEGQ